MTDYSSNRLITEAYEGMNEESQMIDQDTTWRLLEELNKAHVSGQYRDPTGLHPFLTWTVGSFTLSEFISNFNKAKTAAEKVGLTLDDDPVSLYDYANRRSGEAWCPIVWNDADGVDRKRKDGGSDYPEDYHADNEEYVPYPTELFNESDVGGDRLLSLLSSSSRRLYGCESKLRDLCDELGDGASVPSDVVVDIRRVVGILKDARKRIHGEIDRRSSLG